MFLSCLDSRGSSQCLLCQSLISLSSSVCLCVWLTWKLLINSGEKPFRWKPQQIHCFLNKENGRLDRLPVFNHCQSGWLETGRGTHVNYPAQMNKVHFNHSRLKCLCRKLARCRESLDMKSDILTFSFRSCLLSSCTLYGQKYLDTHASNMGSNVYAPALWRSRLPWDYNLCVHYF